MLLQLARFLVSSHTHKNREKDTEKDDLSKHQALEQQAHLQAGSSSVLGTGELVGIEVTPRYVFKYCGLPACTHKI